MDGWVRVLRPFNSISVISRRWKGEHERLCAMKRRLGSGRISPPAGFEPATPWSEVGSANRSATRTLLSFLMFIYLVANPRRQVFSWRGSVDVILGVCIPFPFEPCHEIMALSVLRKRIHQTRMRSHPVGLDVWFLSDPSSTSMLYVCKQGRLWGECADA